MIPNTKEIQMFFHCRLCFEEYQAFEETELSPAEYQQIEVGWTIQGIQAWCRRHDANIIHIDFEGAKHPANLTRKKVALDP